MNIHAGDWVPSAIGLSAGLPMTVAADSFASISPHAPKIAGALGTAATVLAILYPFMRQLLRYFKAFADPKEGAKAMLTDQRGMVEQLQRDMMANTEMTQRVLATNSRLQNTILEQVDVREMVHEFRGELVGIREGQAATREFVENKFNAMMEDYRGLGDMIRSVKSKVDKIEEWRVIEIGEWRKGIDERLKKADIELEALRKTGTESP